MPGFPIRTSTDRSLVGSSPWLIAASHVLLRLQAPRHPPLALCSLENKDARARYGILKGRVAPLAILVRASGPDGVRAAGRHLGDRHRMSLRGNEQVAPSKRNSEVRRSRIARDRGRPGMSTEGHGQPTAAGMNERRIASDRLGVSPTDTRSGFDSLERR